MHETEHHLPRNDSLPSTALAPFCLSFALPKGAGRGDIARDDAHPADAQRGAGVCQLVRIGQKEESARILKRLGNGSRHGASRIGPSRPRIAQRGGLALHILLASFVGIGTFTGDAAHAKEPLVHLAWRAPAGCPSTNELQARVERLLGESSHSARAHDLHVDALVEHGRAWTVTLVTESSSERGKRTIEAGSCQGLAEATTLILALMIDPDAVHNATVAPPSSSAGIEPSENALRREPLSMALRSSSSAIASPPTAQSAPSPRSVASAITPTLSPSMSTGPIASAGPDIPGATPISSQGRRPNGLLALHGDANAGVLPSPELGLGGSLGISYEAWRLELRATYGILAEYHAASDAVAGASGEFHLSTATLIGCLVVEGRWIAWGPCGDVEVGIMLAEGSGATQNFRRRTTWVGVGGGAFVATRLGESWSFPLHLDLIAPLQRPVFIIENTAGAVFQPARLGGRATLGVEWRF